MQYTCLLSSSYSGSTLVSVLLGAHPRVIGFGDTYALPDWDYSDSVCTCGAKLLDCPFRQQLQHKMAQRGFSGYTWLGSQPTPLTRRIRSPGYVAWYWLLRALPNRACRAAFKGFYRETNALLQALAGMTSCTHYFDGCKSLARVELLRAADPDLRIVHLVKDPRAYIHSCLSKYMQGADHKPLLRRWMLYNQWAHDYRSKLGDDRYFLLYYHDLARNPENVLQQLYDFIDVDAPPITLDEIDITQQHVIGNRMRKSFKQVEDRSTTWCGKLPHAIEEDITHAVSKLDWLTLQQ